MDWSTIMISPIPCLYFPSLLLYWIDTGNILAQIAVCVCRCIFKVDFWSGVAGSKNLYPFKILIALAKYLSEEILRFASLFRVSQYWLSSAFAPVGSRYSNIYQLSSQHLNVLNIFNYEVERLVMCFGHSIMNWIGFQSIKGYGWFYC